MIVLYILVLMFLEDRRVRGILNWIIIIVINMSLNYPSFNFIMSPISNCSFCSQTGYLNFKTFSSIDTVLYVYFIFPSWHAHV
jgi:hypothetical protein